MVETQYNERGWLFFGVNMHLFIAKRFWKGDGLGSSMTFRLKICTENYVLNGDEDRNTGVTLRLVLGFSNCGTP